MTAPARRNLLPPALLAALLAVALAILAAPPARAAEYRAEVLVEGLDRPWALAFLPGSGDLIMTGRGGALWLWHGESGALQPLAGAPQVDARGQGGLLDIAPAPDFAETALLYLVWSGADARGHTATHLGRARLDRAGQALRDLELLYVAEPFVNAQGHYGARIVVDGDHVFVGLGDRQRKDFGPDHIAQDLSNAYGAVIRLNRDGSVPGDNPFVGEPGAEGAIWSYGHRNIQAMARHPETGALWLAEHGESGGDEVNIVERGGNYGWPLASFGVDYRSGRAFAPPHQEGDGFIAPVYHWPAGRDDHFPPSGMAFYTGTAFPGWQGHMLIGNLRHQYLGLFAVEERQVTPVARLLDGAGWRIRDVAVGPDDGFIYVIGDGPGAPLLRLVPAR